MSHQIRLKEALDADLLGFFLTDKVFGNMNPIFYKACQPNDY